ncbi:MAG: isochorismatase family protein, partial [Ilumatobacteraceae bacterium]|nr:isochorismatase family protein [Ilumatobacteraceae bacterium]
GTVMSAVDLGYNVVIVSDGVCGVPREYAEDVLKNSLSLLATIASADEVIAAWN